VHLLEDCSGTRTLRDRYVDELSSISEELRNEFMKIPRDYKCKWMLDWGKTPHNILSSHNLEHGESVRPLS